MEHYSVRTLETLEEKKLARRFLYKIYVEELGWIPPVGNPSNLKIIQESLVGNMLVDDYDSEAIQFGGFYGEKLIAVHRLIPRFNGCLDVENYIKLPTFKKKKIVIMSLAA